MTIQIYFVPYVILILVGFILADSNIPLAQRPPPPPPKNPSRTNNDISKNQQVGGSSNIVSSRQRPPPPPPRKDFSSSFQGNNQQHQHQNKQQQHQKNNQQLPQPPPHPPNFHKETPHSSSSSSTITISNGSIMPPNDSNKLTTYDIQSYDNNMQRMSPEVKKTDTIDDEDSDDDDENNDDDDYEEEETNFKQSKRSDGYSYQGSNSLNNGSGGRTNHDYQHHHRQQGSNTYDKSIDSRQQQQQQKWQQRGPTGSYSYNQQPRYQQHPPGRLPPPRQPDPSRRPQSPGRPRPPNYNHYADNNYNNNNMMYQRISSPSSQRLRQHQQQQPSSRTVWTLLWKRVGKGFDGLANLDEAIAGRAQKLVATTKTSLQRSQTQPSSTKSTQSANPQAQGTQSVKKPPERSPFDNFSAKYKAAAAAAAAESTKKKEPPGHSNKFDSNNSIKGKTLIGYAILKPNGGDGGNSNNSGGDNNLASSQSSHRTDTYQQNTSSLGGASSSSSTSPPPSSSSNDNPSADSNSRTASQTRINHPYATAMYSKRPQPTGNNPNQSRSRESRIPWDRSGGSTTMQRQRQPTQSGYSYDDGDDDKSWMSRLSGLIPPVPKMPSISKLLRPGKSRSPQYASLDAWGADDDDDDNSNGFFSLFRRRNNSQKLDEQSMARTTPAWKSQRNDNTDDRVAPLLGALMDRSDDGKSTLLLTDSEKSHARSIGRSQALGDIIQAMFLMIALRQITENAPIQFSRSFATILAETLPAIGDALQNSLLTWAPFAVVVAYLTSQTICQIYDPKIDSLVSSCMKAIQEECEYSQLYHRLVDGTRLDPKFLANMQNAATSQIFALIASCRLTSYVTFVTWMAIMMTVSVARPIVFAIFGAGRKLASLEQLRSWPIDWQQLMVSIQGIVGSATNTIKSLLAAEVSAFLDHPLRTALHASVFVSLLLLPLLLRIETRRKVYPIEDDDDDEIDIELTKPESANRIYNLGMSSATRLGLLAQEGGVENILEQWRTALPTNVLDSVDVSITSLIRFIGLSFVFGLVLMAPIILSWFLGPLLSQTSSSIIRKHGMADKFVLLFVALKLAWDAVSTTFESSKARPPIIKPLSTLADTVKETTKLSQSPQFDIQVATSLSPTDGLAVRDLWAAHTSKRAWAVRGTNLACRAGEVMILLGDDGSGKSRVLTAIAESFLFPPRRALTVNKVRGIISLGGVDIVKLDRTMLKKRLGLVLNDVRTLGDTASVLSGMTLEEILEPTDGSPFDPSSQGSGPTEKAFMIAALKITGLASSLMPRLPSKLSTVITCNEEDLRPSPSRSWSAVLSPPEWSKLLIARVLVQALHDNDYSAPSARDKSINSLVGTVLLLDDPTVMMSEVEEANLIDALRKTGAAVIISSNKWATGRLADHIAVLKDGAVVESGTHNELLVRGPQQSLYAAKWYAMTKAL